MNFVQLLRKANDLKVQLTAEGGSDAWVSRQALQDAFHQLLLLDLETALDKKLEQELWNHVFKNHISSLQHKARDRMNPKRSEVQAMLSLLLDNASGFYIQLLQEICSAFNVQLVCRIKAQRLGLFQETLPSPQKPVQPKAVSCHYICQHCLVHLGDIARYRNDTHQAESFYCHAASLVPSNGQPYNQLAIVSATKGDQLSMAFYYIRSIAVKHPFPAAATNLQTTYAKLVDRDEVKIFKMREVELIHYFIKFHAIIYLATCEQDLQVASSIKDKLEENFRSHLSQEILTSRQLTQMAAINLFALHSIRQHTDNGERGTTKMVVTELGGLVGAQDLGPYAANNLQCWTLVMGFTFNLLQMMLHYAPQKGGESPLDAWPGLPSVRLLLGWIYLQPAIFDDPVLSTKTGVWSKLGRVLTSLQVDSSPRGDDSTSSLPLPEDNLLDGFTPLQEFQRDLDFGQNKRQGWNRNAMNQERSQRLTSQGKWLAHHQPSLLKVETTPTNKLAFTSPLGDDVTSRRSSHHQQRQQRAAKAATNTKASETASRSASLEKDTPKKVIGTQRKEGNRERGNEENHSKTIAVQAIMSRPNSEVNKPTVTFKTQSQERSNVGNQGGSSKSSKSVSSSGTKDQEGSKRHVQWQNPPHAYAQDTASYYPPQPHPTQPHPSQPHPNPQPHLGPGATQQGQQPQGPGNAPPPRHPPPSGPYPQQGGQQRMPQHPYGHPPPPGVPPPSMGIPPPDPKYPPPPHMGPPPSFNPGGQNAPPRPMHPPPPRPMGPPPSMPHGAPPGWQQVHRDGPPSPHVGRDAVPPPHMQPPKVQIPPPMPQGTQLSSPNSNLPQPQGHPHHQGGWPTRPGPMPTVGERQEDHSAGDTMTNISMWNAAMQDKLNHSHLQRGGPPDMQQYQQQGGQQGMGRDTSPMRSPIGNSPQFRLSPSVEDFGDMRQGPGQANQPQTMARRMSNPTEMQMQGYGQNKKFDQGRMNYMPSMTKPHDHSGHSQQQQQQQKQHQQPGGGPPPQILDNQGANLLELLAKMQRQIIPEGPVGSGSTKMRYSPEEHSVDSFRANLDNPGHQQKNVRDPPGFRNPSERFYDEQLAKNNGRTSGADYYGMQQGDQRGMVGYNPLSSRTQGGGSAFRKVQPQQPDGEDSLFNQPDMESKSSRSYEPGDAFSFFSPSSGQPEKHPQQQQLLVGENLKYGRDIFGQESGLQEPTPSFQYRRSSGGLYENSTPGFTSSQPQTSGSDKTWRMENREDSNEHLRSIFPGPSVGGGGGSGGGGGGGGNAGRRGSEETTGGDRWRGNAMEQLPSEGARRPSQDALFNQMNSGGSGQGLFQREPFMEQETSAPYPIPQHHQTPTPKNSYFSGSSLKGKQSDEENVFSNSGNSYSLFSSPSPWSSRQEEDGGGMSKSGEGLGSTLGLKWRDPQLSSSPTSSLLPERIQSIWSSPLRSEQSPLEKILGHTVSLEQQKPDT